MVGSMGDGHGQAPLDQAPAESGEVVRCQDLSGVPQAAEAQFGKEIAGYPGTARTKGWLCCQSKGLCLFFALLPKKPQVMNVNLLKTICEIPGARDSNIVSAHSSRNQVADLVDEMTVDPWATSWSCAGTPGQTGDGHGPHG